MTVSRVSAAGPLLAPLIAALLADAPLAALLNGDKVYSGRVPHGMEHVTPYILLTAPSEQFQPVFGQGATANQLQLHIYSDTPDLEKVLLICGHIGRVLHAPIAVPGFEAGPGGSTTLLTTLTDPATNNLHGVVVFQRYHVGV